MKAGNKTTVDVLDPNVGWVECWKCLLCDKLFPLMLSECPHCGGEKQENQLKCERPEII